MRITKTIQFIFQFVTIGLAAAFVILFLVPGLKDKNGEQSVPPVVEFIEAPTDSTDTPPVNGAISYADAVALAAPTVVNIHTQTVVTERSHPLLEDPVFRHFFGDNLGVPRKRMESSLGSGVIISKQGYILTNNHVIAAADEIQIAMHDGRIVQAKIVGTDPDTDLAVLKIELDELPVITLGHSENLRVGDVVLAIGNPFGVGQTVTSGIVSATGRDMLGINTFEDFIQTDAAINPGNSGGALISAKGELVGINTAIFSKSGGSQGIGFAIPTRLAKDVMQQIIQYGTVRRGWLGVAIQDLNAQLATSLGLGKAEKGVVVTNIIRNGPADEAGLDRGDVITHINDQPAVNVKTALKLISMNPPGSTIKLSGIRKAEATSWSATVIQRPAPINSRAK